MHRPGMSMHESHYLQVSRACAAGVTKYFANAELLPHVEHSIAHQIVKIKKIFAVFNYFTIFGLCGHLKFPNAYGILSPSPYKGDPYEPRKKRPLAGLSPSANAAREFHKFKWPMGVFPLPSPL